MYWDADDNVWSSGYASDERAMKWLVLSGAAEFLEENPEQYADVREFETAVAIFFLGRQCKIYSQIWFYSECTHI